MSDLLSDIIQASDWIARALGADGYRADYTIRSLQDIDMFMDDSVDAGVPRAGGRLAENTGTKLFALGSYVGQTIVRAVPGAAWVLDEDRPEAELSAAVRLPDGSLVFPVQRLIKRFASGAEESLYGYTVMITLKFADEKAESIQGTVQGWSDAPKKHWWRFW